MADMCCCGVVLVLFVVREDGETSARELDEGWDSWNVMGISGRWATGARYFGGQF
jgi:hypothetical protein